MRELAWVEVMSEPPPVDAGEEKLMDDETFDREVALAAAGRWSELDLDELPADWEPTTVEDLRNA